MLVPELCPENTSCGKRKLEHVIFFFLGVEVSGSGQNFVSTVVLIIRC